MRVYAHQSCPSKPDQCGLTQSTCGGGFTRIERIYLCDTPCRAPRKCMRNSILMQLLGLSGLLRNVYACVQPYNCSATPARNNRKPAKCVHDRIQSCALIRMPSMIVMQTQLKKLSPRLLCAGDYTTMCSFSHKRHSFIPSLPQCQPNSSFSPCMPDLNLNMNLDAASLTPLYHLIKCLIERQLNLAIQPLPKLPSPPLLDTVLDYRQKTLEHSPLSISCNHSALSRPNVEINNPAPTLPLPTPTWLEGPFLIEKLLWVSISRHCC